MKKEFIPYELALRMKQLGFNEPCLASWSYTYELQNHVELKLGYIIDGPNNYTNAPSFQQSFIWFREKYGLHSYLSPKLSYPDDTITGEYYINILCNKFDYDVDNDGVYLYEEAKLACLEKLIEIVESKERNDET